MSVQIKGLREVEQNMKKLSKDINKSAAKAIRKGLNGAARSLEKSIKPNVPTLKTSTNFRQKGTIKNNIRHKTKIAKDGLSGITTIRVMRTKGRKMARIGENTKDKSVLLVDGGIWHSKNEGTKLHGKRL